LRADSAPEEGFLPFFLEVLAFWTIIFYTPSAEAESLELPANNSNDEEEEEAEEGRGGSVDIELVGQQGAVA
jgi:hypothetical protein